MSAAVKGWARLVAVAAVACAACHEQKPDASGEAGASAKASGTMKPGATANPGATTTGATPGTAPNAPLLPGEEVLATQPKVEPLKPFAAPVPRLATLSNGLRVYLVERPGDGIEAIDLLIRRGSAADPAKKPGVASLTAAMLEAGSAGKSQTEMAAAVDALGASLRVGAGEDGLGISISGMPTRLQDMVRLLADVARRPNFEVAEWKRLQAQRLAELQAARAEPTVAASLAFSAALYGDHPLGRPPEGTPESVRAMKLAELKKFFQGFSPREAAVVAVGGAKEAEVLAALEAGFGAWKAPREKPAASPDAVLAAPSAHRPRLVLVDFPGKPQTVLRVGQPSVPRSSPDALALRLLDSVLGGSFTSRLMQNLREAHGYTYGARSAFLFGRGPGAFVAVSSVKTDVTGPALHEMLKELDGVVASRLTPAELAKGKALLAYGLAEQLQHADAAAGAIGEIFLYDLPLDEYRTFVTRLQGLTLESVQAAARRALDPARMTIVAAGDRNKIGPQLQTAGIDVSAAELRGVDGQPAAAAQ